MEKFEYCIEVLSNHHDKSTFLEALAQQASQDARRHVAATFILLELSSNNVAGYYTLSSTSIESNDLPLDKFKIYVLIYFA